MDRILQRLMQAGEQRGLGQRLQRLLQRELVRGIALLRHASGYGGCIGRRRVRRILRVVRLKGILQDLFDPGLDVGLNHAADAVSKFIGDKARAGKGHKKGDQTAQGENQALMPAQNREQD